jgi:pyruvate/2-oxoglutarate/acetoin dehydrogenase E1 component
MSKKITVSKAIGEALHEEMLRDEKVFIMGEDMAVMGNVFAITKGFLEEFGPNRVIDTPISEEGFVGMAVGAAVRGMRPVVELMYDDFATECADPLFNQAAKIRYMTGGQCNVPMVLRAPMGAGRRNAGQHSQSLENFFCHFPGLKVAAPCTAKDAKGMLKAAIRDDDPVIFWSTSCSTPARRRSRGRVRDPPGPGGGEAGGHRPDRHHLEPGGELLPGGRGDAGRPGHQRGGPGPAEPGAPGLGRHRPLRLQDPQRGHRLRGGQARQLRGELSAQIAEELFDELDAPWSGCAV